VKVVVAKNDLNAALQIVSTSIASKGMEIESHYVFRAVEDGHVEVLTTSGRVFSSAKFVAKVEDADTYKAFTIEGWRLKKWLGSVGDVALSFTFDGTLVTAAEPKGTNEFQSLDPGLFPYWDNHLQEAKSIATVKAYRLHNVFSYLKQFMNSDEGGNPGLCVTEVRNGLFYAATDTSITTVAVEPFKDSTLRVHGKDIPTLQKFLAQAGDEDVEVLEYDQGVFFRRASGPVFGEARYRSPFPNVRPPKSDDADPHWWTVSCAEMDTSLKAVEASAAREDNRVWLRPLNGKVQISMLSPNGRHQKRVLECSDSGTTDGALPIPTDGFAIDQVTIDRVLSHYEGDAIRLGITTKSEAPQTGFVKVTEKRGEDQFLTCAAWLMGY